MAEQAIKTFGKASGDPVIALAANYAGEKYGPTIDEKLGLNKLELDTNKFLNNIFGGTKHSFGRQLSNLHVQSSAYGEVIPSVYGAVRVAGNIIWARPIKETPHETVTSATSGKGGNVSGGVTSVRTDFTYSITLAIALCEGEIDDVTRAWADAKPLNLATAASSYTLHKGSEDQAPDATIESFQGVGSTPAYRGIAYVVIEDFPLEDYGNRIPNFTFEVKRKVLPVDGEGVALEQKITSMIMIPGSGEFVYDTTVQSKLAGQYLGPTFIQNGQRVRINQNNASGKADALVALDQLQAACPNLEWVGLVVTWFGTSTDAGECSILPGVEYAEGASTAPDTWSVGLYERDSAHLITQDASGNPVYGGTPSDMCVLRYLDELQARGLKVMLYPMFFMDTPNKPWRGRVTGTASEVDTFFEHSNGYINFITHYANLVDGKVDAFVIGSELIGLTKVQAGDDSFPAVDHLVDIAATVKGILGSGVKVGYAADWSEYHHTEGGWYNLDPLWASGDLDFIGIDAYFPLTDRRQNGYDLQEVIDGWTSGEGYDWYYSDEARTVQEPLDPEYAWKNIAWWWSNTHTNPDSSVTGWVPESKPLWFTEFGFPSVDGASNQPNVFYDPSSSESFFPRHSRGTVDFRAQRLGLEASFAAWEGSAMVQNMFIWTWDARPFPFWPLLKNVWADWPLWRTGHWVNGKLGVSGLSAIVADLCRRAGLTEGQFDTSLLTDLVDGYVLDKRQSARACIEMLQRAYFFDAVESEGVVRFLPRGREAAAEIDSDELVPLKENPRQLLQITRADELGLPQKVDVTYLNRAFDYQVGSQYAERLAVDTEDKATVSLSVVMGDVQAKTIAQTSLYNAWMERTTYRFRLPAAHASLEPTDVVEIADGAFTHRVRITHTAMQENSIIEVQGVAEDSASYQPHNYSEDTSTLPGTVLSVGDTKLELLDLPLLPADTADESFLRFAVAGYESGWRSSIVYRSDDGGASYRQVTIASDAAMGTATGALGEASPCLWDEASTVEVVLLNGELESVTELAVLNGANAALLGDEIIQFRMATLTAPGVYTLSGLLRGRLGTESATATHEAGERFVLLDARLARIAMPIAMLGLARLYKPVSVGHTLAQAKEQSFTWNAVSLRPYAPVHITGERNGSDDLTINWVRRTRIGGDWRDNADVPLGETSEAYEVDILDGGDVVRTITGLPTSSASYTAAQQTADFGSPQSSVTVRVYQLSATVGRGRAGEAIV